MDYEKKIDIPFGANDSELKGWEYTIPEGMEAEIKDGKVIVRQKESEDERIRKQLINEVKEQIENIPAPDCCDSDDLQRLTILQSWLAYLEKQKEQKPVQDREEREYVRTLKSLIVDFLRDKECVNRGYYQDIYDWLDGRHIEQQPKQEWSEEDEEHLDSIIESYKELLKDYSANHGVDYIPYNTPVVARTVLNDIKFLKSLRPQPHWKPSEEQMDALNKVVNGEVLLATQHKSLESLYNFLKKL